MKSLIYALVDSRAPFDIRYVGKTIDPSTRLKRHLASKNSPCANWIQSVLETGGKVLMIELDTVDRERASECERFATQAVKLLGARLTNRINAGSGSNGFVMSAEARAKISTARKGMKFSEEHKRRISEAQRGQKRPSSSKSTIEKTAAAQRGVPKSPAHKAALAAGQRRRFARERANRLVVDPH